MKSSRRSAIDIQGRRGRLSAASLLSPVAWRLVKNGRASQAKILAKNKGADAKLTTLRCFHTLHSKCWAEWAKHTDAAGQSQRRICPECKENVDVDAF